MICQKCGKISQPEDFQFYSLKIFYKKNQTKIGVNHEKGLVMQLMLYGLYWSDEKNKTSVTHRVKTKPLTVTVVESQPAAMICSWWSVVTG